MFKHKIVWYYWLKPEEHGDARRMATPKRLNSHDSTRSENGTNESLTRRCRTAQLTNRGENVKENKQRKKEAKKENKKRKKLPYLTLLGKRARIKVR